jgi:hypothetical protein
MHIRGVGVLIETKRGAAAQGYSKEGRVLHAKNEYSTTSQCTQQLLCVNITLNETTAVSTTSFD